LTSRSIVLDHGVRGPVVLDHAQSTRPQLFAPNLPFSLALHRTQSFIHPWVSHAFWPLKYLLHLSHNHVSDAAGPGERILHPTRSQVSVLHVLNQYNLIIPSRNCKRPDLLAIIERQVACWPKERHGRFEKSRTRMEKMIQALTEPGSAFRKAPAAAGGSTMGNGGQGPVTTPVLILDFIFPTTRH
jgi:hypothetical protein